MMAPKTLHILNKPPEHSRYRLCLSAMGPEDLLLLIENGVLAVTQQPLVQRERFYALGPDLEARGLTEHTAQVQTISFTEMVELTLSAQKVISW